MQKTVFYALLLLALVATAFAANLTPEEKFLAKKQKAREAAFKPDASYYSGLSRKVMEAPAEWTCDPEFYDTLDGCDCECGVYDPDCETQPGFVFNCDDEDVTSGYDGDDTDGEISIVATCNLEAQCEYEIIEVPAEWTCSTSFYGTKDGCDCDCGSPDPDCDVEGQAIFNCQDGVGPSCVNDVCEYEAPLPAGWSCLGSYYAAADGCDCDCGAFDPDCALPETEGGALLGCPCDDGDMFCDTNGFCAGGCNNFAIVNVPLGGETCINEVGQVVTDIDDDDDSDDDDDTTADDDDNDDDNDDDDNTTDDDDDANDDDDTTADDDDSANQLFVSLTVLAFLFVVLF